MNSIRAWWEKRRWLRQHRNARVMVTHHCTCCPLQLVCGVISDRIRRHIRVVVTSAQRPRMFSGVQGYGGPFNVALAEEGLTWCWGWDKDGEAAHALLAATVLAR